MLQACRSRSSRFGALLNNESSDMLLVCGEALMDVFSAGDTPTGVTLDARVGGSPFNVAVGLARLAQPVSFFSALSTGFLGDRLLQALSAEGVGTSTVVRRDAPTTLGLVGLDAQGVPAYAFYGEGGADRQLTPDDLTQLPQKLCAVHIGSFATVVEPIATTLRALVEREQGRALIAYDPNIRLNVEPSLVQWRHTLSWMLPRTDLLKISEEDLQLLLPGMGLQGFVSGALAQGVKLVVVTRGGAGAVAFTSTTHAEVPQVPVKVIDTVGAGDTFQAALLCWLAEHDALDRDALAALTVPQLAAALHFAARAAAITCSRRGADMPRREELS